MIHCMVSRRCAPARRRKSFNNQEKDCTSRPTTVQKDVEKSTPFLGGLASLPRILCQETGPLHQFSFCERIRSSEDAFSRVGDVSRQLDEFSYMSLGDTGCLGPQEPAEETEPAGFVDSEHEKEPLPVGSVGPIQRLCLWSARRPSPYHRSSNARRRTMLEQAEDGFHAAPKPVSSSDSLNFSKHGLVAWFSLDCHYSSSISCLARLGSQLEEKEAAVWEGFAPLQTVLVVAVAAAAAAAAKERNVGEINSLQQALDSKEQSLALLRQELTELWDKVLFDKTSAVSDKEVKLLHASDDQRSLVLEDCLSLSEVAKDGTRDMKRQGSRGWDNPLFGDSIFDVEDPTEWLSVHSSVTSLDSFYGSPQRFPIYASKKMGEHTTRMWQEGESRPKTGAQLSACRAQLASLILDMRKAVTTFLEKEAYGVIAAFAKVIEMAQEFQNYEGIDQVAAPPGKRTPALLALQQSVQHASELVASLQTAVFDVYNTVGPESLAALDISPSEFENWLQTPKAGTQHTKATQANINSWRQWLSMHDGQEIPPTSELKGVDTHEYSCKLQEVVADLDENLLSDLSSCSPWKTRGADVVCALREAVSKAVTTIIAPSPGLSPCSPESIAGELLSELEMAASKVAGMEAQMKSMKAYIEASEKRRKETEIKLADALHANKKIQANATFNVVELTTELRLKELAFDDLERSRKADQALLSEKSAEIRKLKEENKRHNVALECITAVSQSTENAIEKKLAALEDVCKKKDSCIAGLKQEIAALEKQISELTMQSPQRVDKLSVLTGEPTGITSFCGNLESSFQGLGIGDDFVCCTPKRDNRKKATSVQEASPNISSQCILSESKGAVNRSQVNLRESFGGKEMQATGGTMLHPMEGRSKTGMVMHTLNHGESRISGPFMFSDENYLSLLQAANPGTVAPHTTPTNSAPKRGAAVDRDSEHKSVNKAIKENADKRRRWL